MALRISIQTLYQLSYRVRWGRTLIFYNHRPSVYPLNIFHHRSWGKGSEIIPGIVGIIFLYNKLTVCNGWTPRSNKHRQPNKRFTQNDRGISSKWNDIYNLLLNYFQSLTCMIHIGLHVNNLHQRRRQNTIYCNYTSHPLPSSGQMYFCFWLFFFYDVWCLLVFISHE